MIDTRKSYWLKIYPYVYCNIKKDQALLYNTQNGERMEIFEPKILDLLKSLYDKQNLGAIYCEGIFLRQSPYKEFVEQFCNIKLGALVDAELVNKKPIEMMPILNLQQDIEKLKKREDFVLGENILQYLQELNIYLNTSCKNCCNHCGNYFKQSICCNSTNNSEFEELDISILYDILSQVRYGAVGKLNLLGGNLFNYQWFQDIPNLSKIFKGQIHIWNHYSNFSELHSFIPNFFYDIIITFPLIKESFLNDLFKLEKPFITYHFYIAKLEEYQITEMLIKKYKLNHFRIHPIYSETNKLFFEEYVYLHREDIFQSTLSFRRIFAHQKLNTNFFGSLTVLSDGNIYANINEISLGSVYNDKLLDIINKELIENTSWRKIRKKKPCIDCLYQFVCPSPSNYEIISGKPNLCHI